MGRRKEKKSTRGWSKIFGERRDDAPPEAPAAPPAEAPDPATVVDGALASEVRASLAEELAAGSDRLLDNVDLAAPIALAEVNAPEETVRAPAPRFEERTPVLPNLLEAADPTTFDAVAVHPVPVDEPQEAAETRPVPVVSRPAPASVTADEAPTRIPDPVPRVKGSQEATMLDIAAQLGIAPEQRGPTTDVDEGSSDPPLELRPSARDDMELADLLAKTPDLPHPNRPQKAAPSRVRPPGEGLDAGDISRLATNADAVARTIPFIIAIFVLLGTIVAITTMFSGKDERQEHVELRFLSVRGPHLRSFRPSEDPTRFYIDTTPPGIFVVFNREIIGKTPIVADLPVELDERIGVELSGPHFQRWIQEIERTPADEYHIHAQLERQ